MRTDSEIIGQSTLAEPSLIVPASRAFVSANVSEAPPFPLSGKRDGSSEGASQDKRCVAVPGKVPLHDGGAQMAITESSDQHYKENPAPPEAAPGEHADSAGQEPDHAPEGRLKGFSVVLITMIAALGAIVTWRAEVAASTAAEFSQRGVVVSINLAAERAKDRAIALNEETEVMRVQQLLDERDVLGDQMTLALAGPAQDQLTTEYHIQFWVAEWRLRNSWTANFYLQSATTPAYNVERRTADLISESRIPADSASSFARADSEQRKRRYLLLLDIALVLGLSCATVAQLTRHRVQIFCAASGTAVFILSVIAVWLLEA